MAERGADVVCAKLGIDEPPDAQDCRCLLPHTAYYVNGDRL